MPTPTNNDTQIPYLPSTIWYTKYIAAKCCNQHYAAMPPISDLHQLNRCRIAAANGCQTLSLPIEGGSKSLKTTPYRQILISEHGNWRHNHWGAIFSAYGKTPFFEHYAHLFENIYQQKINNLSQLNQTLHSAILEALNLNNLLEFIALNIPSALPDNNTNTLPHYYQLHAEKHGFIENLSIIDLIFNEGPQAIFTLIPSLKSNP